MITYRVHSAAPIQSFPLVREELKDPQPGPGQVRIKVAFCGVCHTDLHIAEGDIHPPHLPVTPGHQITGRIDAIHPKDISNPGHPGRNELKIGQRVGLPWLYSTCGKCDYCKRGLENLCPEAKFTGFSVDGGFGEFVIADADFVLPLPDEISDIQAAPLLCAGIVGYRALKKAEIRPGNNVGLFGFGASAHLSIQVLNFWGCRTSVFTRSRAHQKHALELGAVWAGDAGEEPPAPLDQAVIYAPSGALTLRALELLKPGGTAAINAIHMSDIPSFPYEKIYGERTLRSVANATYQDGQEFLSLALSAGIKSTVTEYPLDKVNEALQDLKASRINGEAVLKVR